MDWKKDMVVRLGCKIHPKMRAYAANITSRYHQVLTFDRTRKTFKVTIEGVPAKLTKVRVWMPNYEPIEVALSPGQTTTVTLKSLLSRNTMESAPELVRPIGDNGVQCLACGHRCKIPDGRVGVCRVRFNEGGILRAPHGYVAGLRPRLG